jgi:capsule polysaccharide export protein KpsE/RkpR
LRNTLRGFALEDARQRRQFYEAQLARARAALDDAQRKLQSSGFDRAALRAEPRAAADSYGRLQGEVAAAEIRLSALRRVRAESSAEVQQLVTEVAAMRRQLAGMELPPDGGQGAFVARVREFRYAETLAESIARQAEAARVDEAADSGALQLLDRARAPEVPSSPQVLQWLVYGAALGFAVQMVWVLVAHRLALARLDPAFQQRVELIRSVLARRRR